MTTLFMFIHAVFSGLVSFFSADEKFRSIFEEYKHPLLGTKISNEDRNQMCNVIVYNVSLPSLHIHTLIS